MFDLRISINGNNQVIYHRVRYACEYCGTTIISLFKQGQLMKLPFIRKTCGNCMQDVPDIEGCFLKRDKARLNYTINGK